MQVGAFLSATKLIFVLDQFQALAQTAAAAPCEAADAEAATARAAAAAAANWFSSLAPGSFVYYSSTPLLRR